VTFWDKIYRLADKMETFVGGREGVQTSPSPAPPVDRVPGTRKIDVLKYISQATLDAIGIAGFTTSLAGSRRSLMPSPSPLRVSGTV
jgi:hypothetical protein